MTNYKKIVIILLCTLTLWLSHPQSIHADIGPKPSVTITFEGDIPNEYYATLLSEQKSTGPATAYDGTNPRYTSEDAEYAIWQKFLTYEDTDGFYFLQEFWDCTNETSFRWGYYPPQTFKVLIYIPDTNTFIVSDIYERYAFESYFTMSINPTNQPTEIIESYNFTWEMISLVSRIVLTILIELFIAWLFHIRNKKDIKIIVFVNLITQIGLNIALNIINFYKGQWAFVFYYAVLEIAILLVEAIIYKKTSINKAIIYATIANIVSFALGLWIANIIPGIF